MAIPTVTVGNATKKSDYDNIAGKVAVSANDATVDELDAKLVSTGIIAFTEVDDAGTETMEADVKHNHRARAFLTADQDNIVHQQWTTITLDAETYDPGTNFNVGTYAFTAPVSGSYLILAQVQLHELPAGTFDYHVRLNKNAGTIITEIKHAHDGTMDVLTLQIQDIVELTATDTIILQVYNSFPAADTMDITGGAQYTYMAIQLLSIA